MGLQWGGGVLTAGPPGKSSHPVPGRTRTTLGPSLYRLLRLWVLSLSFHLWEVETTWRVRALGGQFVGGLPSGPQQVWERPYTPPALLSSSARCLTLPQAKLSPLHHSLPGQALRQALCMRFHIGKINKGKPY